MQKRGLVRFKATFMIYLVILLTVYISVVMGQEAQVFGFKDENPTPQTNNPEITNYEDLPSNIRDWLPPNFFNKHINSYNPEGKVLKFQDGRSYSGISGFESAVTGDGTLTGVKLKFENEDNILISDKERSNKWMFKNVKNGYVTLLPNSGEEESISMDLDVGGTAKYQDIDRFSSSLTAENKNEEFSSISTHIKDGRRIIETNGFVNTALYGHIDGTAGDIQSNKDGSTIIHVDGNKISSFILQGDSSFSRYGSRTESYIPAQIVPRGGTSLAYILDKDSTLSISELKGNMVDEIYPLGGVVKETKEGLLMDGEYNIFYPVGQTRKLNIIKTEKSLFPEITMNRAAVTDQPDVPLPVFDIEDTRSGTKIENTHENGIMVKVKAPETQSSVQVLAPKLDPMLSDFDALIPDVSNGAGEGDDTKEDIDYKQAHIDIANSLQAASRELKDIESNNASESQKLTMLQKLQKQTQNIVNQCKAHKVICGGIIILAIFLLYRIKKSMEKKGYEFRSPVQLRSPITKEES